MPDQARRSGGDLYEHAVQLGGGPEAALGFVEGALRAGRPAHGAVYGAARRCAFM